MRVCSLIDEDVEPVAQNSPRLQYTLYLNHQYLMKNPTAAPLEDMDEAQRIHSRLKYKYEIGNCLMMRSEHEYRRWIYVKVIQAFGWWLFGRYAPIYAVSFANGEVQYCEEEELWPLSEVLQLDKVKESKRVASPQKETHRPRYDRKSEGIANSREEILNTDESRCLCAKGQCIHTNKGKLRSKYVGSCGEVADENEVF